MASKPMWVVRAGAGDTAYEEFHAKSIVAIGWGIVEWTKFQSKDRILERIAELNPEATRVQVLVAASQIERFLREFQVGDRVVTYDPRIRCYLSARFRAIRASTPYELTGCRPAAASNGMAAFRATVCQWLRVTR